MADDEVEPADDDEDSGEDLDMTATGNPLKAAEYVTAAETLLEAVRSPDFPAYIEDERDEDAQEVLIDEYLDRVKRAEAVIDDLCECLIAIADALPGPPVACLSYHFEVNVFCKIAKVMSNWEVTEVERLRGRRHAVFIRYFNEGIFDSSRTRATPFFLRLVEVLKEECAREFADFYKPSGD